MVGVASSGRLDAGRFAMLVVTANWQIGDGSILPPPTPAVVARFVGELRRSAVREGWRSDGRYEPVRSLDVVFAGDTFDLLLSREWQGRHRPWDQGGPARATAERVLAGCLAAGRRLFGDLGTLARHGLPVPAADERGRPAATKTTTVPVRVTLLEGNLDAGLGHDAAEVTRSLPAFVVGTRWEGERVRVEHGHDGDPAWWNEFSGRGAAPSLGQSLVVDLLGRLAFAPVADGARAVRNRLVGRLAAGEIAAWPTLFAETFTSLGASAGESESLASAWRDAVAGWRRSARRCGLLPDAPFDAVDDLAAMLLGRGDPDLAVLLGPGCPVSARTGGGTVVLGHPVPGRRRTGDHPRVVCLGAEAAEEPSFPGVHEIAPVADRPPPPTLVLHDGEGGGEAAETHPPSTRRGTKTRMIGPGRAVRYRIVDAA